MKPSLFTWGALSASNTNFVLCLHPRWPYGFPVQNVTTPTALGNMLGGGYLSYMSQFFSYYRGGIKLKFLFHCNSFVSGRIRISLAYGDDQSTMPAVMPYNQNCPTKFVQIKGTTECEIHVPQCVLYDWISLVSGREMTPWVHVALDGGVLSSGNGTRTPTIQYLVFWAAAEDFQYRMLSNVGQQVPYAGPVEVEGQMQPWRDFQKPFEKFGDVQTDVVQVSSDQPRYVEDMMTRFSEASAYTDDVSPITFLTGGSNDKNLDYSDFAYPRVSPNFVGWSQGTSNLFDSIGNLYMWNSGTVDWKLTVEDDPNAPIPVTACVGRVVGTMFDGTATFYPDPDKPDTGNVTIDTTQWKTIDFSTPFVGVFPWDTHFELAETIDPLPNQVQLFGQSWTANRQTVWKKAGFDFQMSQLLPVPNRMLWPAYVHYARSPELVKYKNRVKLNLKPFPTRKNRMKEIAGNAVTSKEEMQPERFLPVTTTTSLSDDARM